MSNYPMPTCDSSFVARWARRGVGAVLIAACLGVGPAIAQSTSPNGGGGSQVDAYLVGRLWTGRGPAISDAVLVVSGGRIVAAGPRSETDIPEGSVVHDCGQQVAIPGLILAESALGAPEDNDYAITPHLRVVDSLDLFADHYRWLAAGITTVQVAPGARRLLPGQGAVIKLAGEMDQRVLRDVECLRLILNSDAWNPPTVYEPPVGAVSEDRPLEPTRPQLASSLAEAVAGLRALFAAARTTDGAQPTEADQEILLALKGLLEGQNGLRVTARSAAEIRAALRLMKEHNLTSVLVDPRQLSTIVDSLDAGLLESVRGFVLIPPSQPDSLANVPIPDANQPADDEFWETARLLADQGRWDRVALGGVSENEASNLLLLAGLLRRGGVSQADILSSLTLNAAELLKISDRVGSLAVGKDADFVLLSDEPFSPRTRVLATYVSGSCAYRAETERQPVARPIVVRARGILTEHGMSEGAVVVAGDRIAAIGPNISYPLDAEIHSYPDAFVTPGLIDLNAELGVGGALRDRVELNTKLGDFIVSEEDAARLVRESGITTILVGSSRAPSPMMAVKLSDQPRVVKDPVALRFEVSGNLTTSEAALRRSLTQGKSYADQWTKYEADLAEYQRALAAYEEEVKKRAADENASPTEQQQQSEDPQSGRQGQGESAEGASSSESQSGRQQDGAGTTSAEKTESKQDDPLVEGEQKPAGPQKPDEPRKPEVVAALEPFRAVFAGDLPIIVVAQQATAIDIAVRVAADEFKLPVTIAGADEADLALASLRRPNVSVAVGPALSASRGNQQVQLPQVLATAGIPFGFQSNAATGSSRLPLAVAFATYRGLGSRDALAALSRSPAEFLRLGDIGKLAVGCGADLVVWSGPPFDLGSVVLAVMIDGKWVYQRETE